MKIDTERHCGVMIRNKILSSVKFTGGHGGPVILCYPYFIPKVVVKIKRRKTRAKLGNVFDMSQARELTFPSTQASHLAWYKIQGKGGSSNFFFCVCVHA